MLIHSPRPVPMSFLVVKNGSNTWQADSLAREVRLSVWCQTQSQSAQSQNSPHFGLSALAKEAKVRGSGHRDLLQGMGPQMIGFARTVISTQTCQGCQLRDTLRTALFPQEKYRVVGVITCKLARCRTRRSSVASSLATCIRFMAVYQSCCEPRCTAARESR